MLQEQSGSFASLVFLIKESMGREAKFLLRKVLLLLKQSTIMCVRGLCPIKFQSREENHNKLPRQNELQEIASVHRFTIQNFCR